MLKKIKFISNLSSPFRETEGIIIWRWLCCLFVFFTACDHNHNHQSLKLTPVDSAEIRSKNRRGFATIEKVQPIIHQGDMILRTGNDFTSESLKQLSFTDKTYSHCGIASIENDTIFVYHALGGEWNPNQKLRRDVFEFFCNPYENRGFGIFRYSLNKNEEANLFRIVHNLYSSGVMFDTKFNLVSDDRMYCSEFVYKSLEKATNYQLKIPLTVFNNEKFVAPDNLYVNSFCKEVLRLKFPLQ